MKPNIYGVTIRLKDRETGKESKEIDMFDLIYNQHDIEFEFGDIDDDDFGTLPYKDFLFFQNDYEVIVKVKGD